VVKCISEQKSCDAVISNNRYLPSVKFDKYFPKVTFFLLLFLSKLYCSSDLRNERKLFGFKFKHIVFYINYKPTLLFYSLFNY
jgi:predicted permease